MLINTGSYIAICSLKTNLTNINVLSLFLDVDHSDFKSFKCYRGNTYDVICGKVCLVENV